MFGVPDAAAAAVDGRHVRQSGADALAVADALLLPLLSTESWEGLKLSDDEFTQYLKRI